MSLSVNAIRFCEHLFGNDVAHEVIALLNKSVDSAGTSYTQTYSTATRTQGNVTAAALTDNGGGTADGTVQSLAATTALTVADGAGTNDDTIAAITADASVIAAVQELAAKIATLITWQAAVQNNMKEVTTQVNALVADLANVKQITNGIINDLRTAGVVA